MTRLRLRSYHIMLLAPTTQGWLGYAKAVSPTNAGRLTYAEATWTNLGVPAQGGAFYSPWFGIETSDNLNLFQPVNPWLGNSWAGYIEYFQWQPENNINSAQGTVRPGDIIYGNVSLASDGKSYDSYHSSSNGWSVRMNVPIQKKGKVGALKEYSIVYFVFEKPANCQQYPPEQKVTFSDIRCVVATRAALTRCMRARCCSTHTFPLFRQH